MAILLVFSVQYSNILFLVMIHFDLIRSILALRNKQKSKIWFDLLLYTAGFELTIYLMTKERVLVVSNLTYILLPFIAVSLLLGLAVYFLLQVYIKMKEKYFYIQTCHDYLYTIALIVTSLNFYICYLNFFLENSTFCTVLVYSSIIGLFTSFLIGYYAMELGFLSCCPWDKTTMVVRQHNRSFNIKFE